LLEERKDQIAGFLLSGGTTIPDPNDLLQPIFKATLFEPATLELERLHF